MTSLHSLISFAALTAAFSIAFLCVFSLIEASNGGFSVDLIHRDSPNSPFYDRSETPSQRIAKALRRSVNRVNSFKPTYSLSSYVAGADIITNGGEYLLKYSIGTPPVEILGFADTRSNLVWLQCQPCKNCYNQTAPLFDPKKSSTYRKIPCSTPTCKSLERYTCSEDKNSSCQYSLTTNDGSYSNGDLAIDTLTLVSSKGLPVQSIIYIGCGYDNGGFFNASGSGIVGLGRGSNSLASQVGLSSAARFSYCLIPFTYQGNATSKLSFGNNEMEFGPGVVSTPLLYRGMDDNNYYVTLKAISVGKKRIELTNPSESGDSEEGNMIIDSGTTVTILPEELFPGFVSAVKDEVHLPIVDDPTFQQLSLCYNSSLDNFRPPSITVHFTGADVELSSETTFISVDEQFVCLAFSPAVEVEPIALFGNLAQSNIGVTIDILNQQVLFRPMDCTKL